MIPYEGLEVEAAIARSQEACDALSDDDDGLKREILAHAGNRWSPIAYTLGMAGTPRHAEIARRLAGVTQRMLMRSLRHLERDGLTIRLNHQRFHRGWNIFTHAIVNVDSESLTVHLP